MPAGKTKNVHYECFDGAASAPLGPSYQRRQPESTVLYQLVQTHFPELLQRAAEKTEHGFGYPGFIERTFERYLECGLLCAGFARVRCDGCGFERLVAFSCKTRGICPSCNARRMHDTAAHLHDRVLPHAPYRQWVLSFPKHIRFKLALDSTLLSKVLRGFIKVLFAWQRRRARKKGIPGGMKDGRCGSITFVQRFGGFVNLNVHFHTLVPDGVFVSDDDGKKKRFIALEPPTDEDVVSLTQKLIRRTTKILSRHEIDGDSAHDALSQTQAASLQTNFSFPANHNANQRIESQRPRSARNAFINGYSLHANVRIHRNDREGLEKLCRYGLRPAISLSRLAWTDDGNIEYAFKRPAPNGNTRLVCSPVDFLAKLVALIPPPRANLTRYHGVFAPNHPWRPDIVPQAPNDAKSASPAETSDEAVSEPPAPVPATILARRLDWAELLQRVFAIDVLECPKCSGRMRILAFITDPLVTRRILSHLGLPTSPPRSARAPPRPLPSSLVPVPGF
jgi:hypothetical protein